MNQYTVNTTVVQSLHTNSPYITGENYKLTRAIWWALFAPQYGRHLALLDEGVPDVYRQLFSAILEGDDSIARLADTPGEALEILSVVTQLKAPSAITPRRLDLPNHADLAAGLFGRVNYDEEGLDFPGIGSGEWPGAPSHTCAAKEAVGTALVLRPNETAAARMFNPTWRTCPACLHKRVKRIARQTLITIATAGPMTWALLEAVDYRKWTGNIRQHRRRTGQDAHYRTLPQEGGRVFVMSSAGLAGAPVPTEKRALYDLIHPHAITPDGKRASSSRGYGGDYKRLRGDGRETKGIRLWTDAKIEDVAKALGATVKPGRNSLRVQIDQHASFQRMADAGIAMRARKGQGAAVQSLMDVTLKVQSAEGEELYLKRDKLVEGERTAPPKVPMRQPTLSDFEGQGGAPCAI